MKLTEAIENGETLTKHGYWTMTPRNYDTIKLLIEAGKYYQRVRPTVASKSCPRLPGETKE